MESKLILITIKVQDENPSPTKEADFFKYNVFPKIDIHK
jgi:hypothetical protein